MSCRPELTRGAKAVTEIPVLQVIRQDEPAARRSRIVYTARHVPVTFLFVLACASAADSVRNDACPIAALATPVRYSRSHQIATRAPEDDITHKVITPGGMVLDTPKMVAAMDVLTISARDPDVVCFHLLTLARDHRKCEFTGVARKLSGDWYLSDDGGIALRLIFLEEDRIHVDPIRAADRSRCEPSGKIDSATYTSSPPPH